MLQQRYQRVYHSHLSMLPEQNYTLPVDGAAEFEWKDINDFTDPYEMRGLRVLIQPFQRPAPGRSGVDLCPSCAKSGGFLLKRKQILSRVRYDPG